MQILNDAHKLLMNRMAARMGTKTVKTVRSRDGVFCPYRVVNNKMKIVSLKDLQESLHFNEIEFASIARDSSEYGLCDPFAWIDRKYGVSRAALQSLTQLTSKVTIVIKTKSDLIACEEYREVLAELVACGHSVRIELTHAWGLDDESARILMPGTPSQKRLETAFEYLKADGFNVTKVNLAGKAMQQ